MPYININEIDNTQYGLSETDSTNIVYCPINAICGTYDPTLITSYDDLIKVYGNSGCESDISFIYAKDIILSGFSVLCKRIEYNDVPGKEGSGCSSGSSDYISVSSKYHGTYMNGVTVKVRVAAAKDDKGSSSSPYTVTVSVNNNGSLLESRSFTANTISELNNSLKTAEFTYIEITDSKFTADKITEDGGTFKYFDDNVKLSGGLDLSNSEGEVSNLVMKAYSEYSTDTDLYNKYLGFLNDKYLWNVKFITSGGYTYDTPEDQPDPQQVKTFKGMISLCESRQDCFAILDLPIGVSADKVKSHFDGLDTTYAAAYAPWCYNKLYDGTKDWMPPSYTFLTNLAQSAKASPIYYPPAGVNRMYCRRTIKTEYEIGAKILNQWQNNSSQCINPIMRIRGTGYAVYGQRTLVNLISPVISTSLKSVTVRFCSIEIKKAIFDASVHLTFEQNILRTWNEFKSRVETTLLEMKKNGGLNSYMIIMDRSTISNSDINNNIARGIVRCAINDAIENFEIGFEISPSYVNFDDESETIESTLTTGDSLN